MLTHFYWSNQMYVEMCCVYYHKGLPVMWWLRCMFRGPYMCENLWRNICQMMPCGWCRKLEMQGLQTVLLLDIYTIKVMFSSKWQRCGTLSLSRILFWPQNENYCQFPSWIAQLHSYCIMNYKFCIVFWETHAMIEKPFTVFPMQTLSFGQTAYFNLFDSMCTS